MTGAYSEPDLCRSGFGQVTNVINGGVECGMTGPVQPNPQNRIDFYNRYAKLFGVHPCRITDDALDCQGPNQSFYRRLLADNKLRQLADSTCGKRSICLEYYYVINE